MLRRQFCLITAALAGIAGAASAEPVYTYTTSAGSFSAAPGQPVQVHLYLQETLGNGDASLINNNSGLFGAGFAVAVAAGQTNAGTLASIAGDITTFDGGFTASPTNTAALLRGDETVGLTDTSGPMTSLGLISLGIVTVDASSIAGTTTTYQVGAYAPGKGGYTQTFKASPFYDLDITNNGDNSATYIGAGGTSGSPVSYNTSFTVYSAVPEPVSGASAVGGIAMLALRPKRRRKAK